jgi:hypothetical protein
MNVYVSNNTYTCQEKNWGWARGQTIIDIVEKREFNRPVNLDSHVDKWREVKMVRGDKNF